MQEDDKKERKIQSGNTDQLVFEATVIEEKITKINGQIVIKKYNKGKKLGTGGFATCYQITSQENGKNLAAKIIKKNTLLKSRAKQKVLYLISQFQKQKFTEVSIINTLQNLNMYSKTTKMSIFYLNSAQIKHQMISSKEEKDQSKFNQSVTPFKQQVHQNSYILVK